MGDKEAKQELELLQFLEENDVPSPGSFVQFMNDFRNLKIYNCSYYRVVGKFI